MHPDLERLIKLQATELELQTLRRTVDTEAERRQAIQDAVDARQATLAQIRERLAAHQHDRREVEKELAQVQTRLSRYKDQLMAVKTNKEYHAMQSEIAVAEAEVRKFEDRILDSMVAADEVASELKNAEREAAQAATDAKAAMQALVSETARAHQQLSVATASRAELAGAMPRGLLAQFETIASHRGAAVVQTLDGHCSVCHVRLRPKAYQDIRRNDTIIQCDSCGRILYYTPPVAPTGQAAGQ